MAERKVYHVVAGNKGWDIKEEGGKTAISHHSTKEEAIEAARKVAEKSGLGQVKIHTAIGAIEEERTYGKDPRKSPG